ncbi:amino acid/amide ABC transporter ATP-binding protein 1, HAAT family [Roseovarius lutimaris]|uniref:Amino acid/amide ABC transporter ATP-binding protein 1, HAAT family n=2 Tax=Roseovarius lutimaris TaxID=1005928 RepID=A0A1I5GS97_9RHOB|nr:amino acid/amide ABC transporter ATP-binding protein 1, HAAT family [Roseovarius lutimaris]
MQPGLTYTGRALPEAAGHAPCPPDNAQTSSLDGTAPISQAVSVDTPLLSVEDICLSFGGIHALDGVSYDVSRGEILSIIGPNGAGKTSMANIICGLYKPTSGRIAFEGKSRTNLAPQSVAGLGISRTFQNLALFRGLSVIENILVGRHRHMRAGLFGGGLHWGFSRQEELEHRQFVEEIITFLEIEDIRSVPADTLSYGLQKRVELGRALAAEPKLLMLDEPMAGMNGDEKLEMVRFIADANVDLGTTIILIEHDMSVVMDISDHVVVLDHGCKIADGTAEEVASDDSVIKAYMGATE